MTVNLDSASPVRQSKARLERDRTHQNISEQSVVLDVCRFLWVGFWDEAHGDTGHGRGDGHTCDTVTATQASVQCKWMQIPIGKKKITSALKALIIILSVATLLPASIRARLPPHAEAMEEEPVEVGGRGGRGVHTGRTVSCGNLTRRHVFTRTL